MRKNTGKPFDLKHWRDAMGLTQKQAAALLGYANYQYYQTLERSRKPQHALLQPACMYYLLGKTTLLPTVIKKLKEIQKGA